ncbi:MAG: signal peptidase II [Clostridia bacterium]|nr:signal peptidase II [Clostridia bacterium]
MILWIIIAVVSVIADFISKRIVMANMALYDTAAFLPGLIEFRYIRNTGAAWGMFSDSRWVFMVLTSIAIIAIPFILYKYGKVHKLFGISLSLIWGGAIGNMIDRVFYGSVVDFINFQFVEFPVFNIADCCVTIGAAMMLVYVIFFDKTLFRDEKKKKEEKTNSVTEENKNDET